MKQQKLHESQITEAALVKLIKIIVFVVNKHWTYTTNYEDTVRFIGEELHEPILSEYLKLTVLHKNATYLLQNSVFLFIKEISNWIKDETVNKWENIRIMSYC